MLQHLLIRDFAIIENTEIDFQDGLNVITGETGSGKSIVIEAVSLALGSRADSSFVRNGKSKAIIQLSATLDEEDYVITREISAAGKNVCKINGQMVTLGEVSALAHQIADIHGQYDNQRLLDPEQHLVLVDQFHHETIEPLRRQFTESYHAYKEARSRLEALKASIRESRKQADFYRFSLNEIDAAHLTSGEDEALTERIQLLQNSEKIFEAVERSHALLNGDVEDGSGILSALGQIQSTLSPMESYSKDLGKINASVAEALYALNDAAASLSTLQDQIVFSPSELDQAISRLDLIDTLKTKYGDLGTELLKKDAKAVKAAKAAKAMNGQATGGLDDAGADDSLHASGAPDEDAVSFVLPEDGATIEGVLRYAAFLEEQLDNVENFDARYEKLETDAKSKLALLKEHAKRLTEARTKASAELSVAIERELHDLKFENAKLDIQIVPASAITSTGADAVDFLISTNKGESMKPLIKIASGGEISRIMLAIKKITGEYDNIPTMIFDEIDAGISGITASVVGRKLSEIAKSHQVICITHLPQIAACGDTNYRIYKETDDSSTFTHVSQLSDSDTVDEIARLLGGEFITETTRASAEELLKKSHASL